MVWNSSQGVLCLISINNKFHPWCQFNHHEWTIYKEIFFSKLRFWALKVQRYLKHQNNQKTIFCQLRCLCILQGTMSEWVPHNFVYDTNKYWWFERSNTGYELFKCQHLLWDIRLYADSTGAEDIASKSFRKYRWYAWPFDWWKYHEHFWDHWVFLLDGLYDLSTGMPED